MRKIGGSDEFHMHQNGALQSLLARVYISITSSRAIRMNRIFYYCSKVYVTYVSRVTIRHRRLGDVLEWQGTQTRRDDVTAVMFVMM